MTRIILFIALLSVVTLSRADFFVERRPLITDIERFDQIAARNGGSRFAQFAGENETLDYVLRRIRNNIDIGPGKWELEEIKFSYIIPSTIAGPSLSFAIRQPDLSFNPITVPFAYFEGFIGDVDVQNVPLVRARNVGCTAADYAGLPFLNNVALIKRGGTCGFGGKISLAADAGAKAVVIYNSGPPDRLDVISNALSTNYSLPFFSISYVNGEFLSSIPNAFATVRIKAEEVHVTSRVAVLTTPKRPQDTNAVVLATAITSSELGTPAIAETGTGLACLLETAIEMFYNNIKPLNRIKFIFYGGSGKIGENGRVRYLAQLPPAEFNKIVGGVRFGNLGGPNWVIGLDPCNPFTAQYETACLNMRDVFINELTAQDLPFIIFPNITTTLELQDQVTPTRGIDTSGSDPARRKTVEERSIFGGLANTPFNPCFDLPCDTVENVDKNIFPKLCRVDGNVLLRLANTPNLRNFIYAPRP